MPAWIAATVLIACLALGFLTSMATDHERADCEARGGVYYQPRGDGICLAQGALK